MCTCPGAFASPPVRLFNDSQTPYIRVGDSDLDSNRKYQKQETNGSKAAAGHEPSRNAGRAQRRSLECMEDTGNALDGRQQLSLRRGPLRKGCRSAHNHPCTEGQRGCGRRRCRNAGPKGNLSPRRAPLPSPAATSFVHTQASSASARTAATVASPSLPCGQSPAPDLRRGEQDGEGDKTGPRHEEVVSISCANWFRTIMKRCRRSQHLE